MKFNSWIEISEKNYKHNINFFKQEIGNNIDLSVVLKANAYGHGLLEIASLAQKNNIKIFCVHSFEEGMFLRNHGFIEEKIVLIGPILFSNIKEAIKNNLEPVTYNLKHLKEIEKVSQELNVISKIHLKIETGTNRQGLENEELTHFLDEVKKSSSIKLDSVYSHFANIEDTTNQDYALFQLKRFENAVLEIKKAGFKDIKLHMAPTSATAIFFQKINSSLLEPYSKIHNILTSQNMVRIGIGQYGLWPSKETFLLKLLEFNNSKNSQNKPDLKPILTWKTRISQIKTIKEGSFIGYGCTYQTTRKTTIAILPIGYSDGYDRKLSNQSYVLIHGKRAPVRGRVMMNLIVVDITDIPNVKIEDEVVLLGKQKNDEISAETLASWAGTINYEIVARISPFIPRIVV